MHIGISEEEEKGKKPPINKSELKG